MLSLGNAIRGVEKSYQLTHALIVVWRRIVLEAKEVASLSLARHFISIVRCQMLLGDAPSNASKKTDRPSGGTV